MGVSRNIRDFTDLICECLSQGWVYTNGQPTEVDLQHWAQTGRAMTLFRRSQCGFLEMNHQVIHLIRCKEESSVLQGYRRLCSVGLWTAWIEDHVTLQPHEPKTHDLERVWI